LHPVNLPHERSTNGKKANAPRDDLIGEHALTDIGQLVLAVLFFSAWTVDAVVLELTMFLEPYMPTAVCMPIAAFLFALSGSMAWASHRTIFGTRRETPHVVRTGFFRLTRHPMYLSEILLYLGFLLLGPSLIAAGVWLVTIGFLHCVARTEERLLLERFADDYAQYMKDVPMWIPRPRRRKQLNP